MCHILLEKGLCGFVKCLFKGNDVLMLTYVCVQFSSVSAVECRSLDVDLPHWPPLEHLFAQHGDRVSGNYPSLSFIMSLVFFGSLCVPGVNWTYYWLSKGCLFLSPNNQPSSIWICLSFPRYLVLWFLIESVELLSQPFLVSPRNAPPGRCVTIVKTTAGETIQFWVQDLLFRKIQCHISMGDCR